MTVYVALLRGINVGGRTRIAMADLRQAFAGAGHEDARTYIQSGNVVFSATGKPDVLAKALEAAVADATGVAPRVLLRTGAQLDKVLGANPFLAAGADPSALHVTFLAEAPARAKASALAPPAGVTDELALVGREVHLHTPGGYGRTKLDNSFVERTLGVAATTRNWRTVTKLVELAAT